MENVLLANGQTQSELFIQNFVADYVQKIYYFCLKRTGTPEDAEDLASEVSLAVITSLNRGSLPEHFSAWIWQIARNCYSSWAEKNKKKRERSAAVDIYEQEIPDDAEAIEETLVKQEQLNLLRRELAFAASEYRDLLVAYYVEERSVYEIAKGMNCPPGTIMSKLHRARQKLKEGMNMAREFGQRSYNPELIGFSSSGWHPTDLPWAALRTNGYIHLLRTNILCQAHNNPSTLEELSMELGVAMPYMEDEVGFLVKCELMRKLDNGKYLTNFFILSKECQNELHERACRFAEEHGTQLWELAGSAVKMAREYGVTMGKYSVEDAAFTLALLMESIYERTVIGREITSYFHRADGGNWGFLGEEQGSTCRLPFVSFSNNGKTILHNDRRIMWDGFQVDDKWCTVQHTFTQRRYDQDCPPQHLLPYLRKVAETPENASFLTGENRHEYQSLLDGNYCYLLQDGNLAVNALVFSRSQQNTLADRVKKEPLALTLLEAMKAEIAEDRKIIAKYGNPYLKDDFDYYVHMSVSIYRFVLASYFQDQKLYHGSYQQFCWLEYED
ncbi:MAG: sigma-70 family RNA polymerase sigma factor [Lachnospiraceae bacterium]|nr:sigma-70 family RNA polymerase sigma factor [Lachnospiraceae bacterium]